MACPADMSASDSNARVFDRAEAELGPVTGLVCAGMRRHYAPAELMTDEQWDVVIGDGLTGYFRSAREAARRMLPRGHGSIAFVTSTAARSAIVNGAAYVSRDVGIRLRTRSADGCLDDNRAGGHYTASSTGIAPSRRTSEPGSAPVGSPLR